MLSRPLTALPTGASAFRRMNELLSSAKALLYWGIEIPIFELQFLTLLAEAIVGNDVRSGVRTRLRVKDASESHSVHITHDMLYVKYSCEV